jgi:predicted  nucleic acid-binding Zn-ribbon protein
VATELESLLVLQADDLVIHELETRLAALEPRIKELDQRKQRILDVIARSQTALTGEEKKQAYLRDKIAEHKLLIERNQAQMDAVKNMKQATAAEAQMGQAKQIVFGEESDLTALSRRVDDMRAVLGKQQSDLAAIEAEQESARAEVASERGAIGAEMISARDPRAAAATAVPDKLRITYDKVRGRKRVEAVFAMRGMSCGSCDTAIPMQRRHTMTATGAIELCEACGVLMYFPVLTTT